MCLFEENSAVAGGYLRGVVGLAKLSHAKGDLHTSQLHKILGKAQQQSSLQGIIRTSVCGQKLLQVTMI